MKNLLWLLVLPVIAYSVTHLGVPPTDILTGSHTEDSIQSKYTKSVSMGQSESPGNTKTIVAADAQPSSPWVGTWEETRMNGIVRQLITITSDNTASGGTFTFEYGGTAGNCANATAVISEARVISTFNSVRDFDLLNAGDCFRVKYEPTEALSGNSVFLTTIHRRQFDGPFVRLGNQEIERQNAAMPQSFAYLKGFESNGVSRDVAINGEGALATTEYLFDASRGEFSGVSTKLKFGNNSDVDTAAEDIWANGGNYTGFPSETETVECFSASANDTSAGTGARTMRLEGLDANFDEQTVDITLSGATPVATSETWTRLNRAYVLTAGSGGENAGIIQCRHTTTTANIFLAIPAGNNQTTVAAYTIPNNKTGYLVRYRVSMTKSGGSAGSAVYTIRVREPNSVFRGIRREDISTNFQVDINAKGSITLPEKTDIKIRMESASSNNNSVSGALEIVLVDD